MNNRRSVGRTPEIRVRQGMPRYFFDVFDGEKLTRDEIGIELAGLEQVRIAAIDALPDIARDELPNGDQRLFSVEARDQENRVVFKASLNFKAEWADHTPKGRPRRKAPPITPA